MEDKIINVIAIISIIAILTGLLIAIWFGIVGLKIAASGAVAFIADWLLFIWFRAVRKRKRRKRD